MDKMELRPQNGIKTVWGWQHSKTGEVLNAAYAYFDDAYEAEDEKPNQGKPIGTINVHQSGKPKIDTQPVNMEYNVSPLSFTVASSITDAVQGDELTYKWQFKKSSESTYRDLTAADTSYSGINTNTLTVTGADKTMVGDRFRCVVSVKNSSVTSSPAEILTGAA